MRVAIADDVAGFRDALAELIYAAGHEVVHSLPGGEGLVGLLSTEPVDVAVLDVRMPPWPEGGLVTARQMRSCHPSTGLLLLSHRPEAHHFRALSGLGSGGLAYYRKDQVASVPSLCGVLERVARGAVVLDAAARLAEVHPAAAAVAV